jgi:hypothetical protein
LLLESQDLEQAGAALEATLKVDRGQDLSKLIELAQRHGGTKILARLSELNIEEQIVGISEADRLPGTLAVRNGHFELGLDSYWEPWASVGACLADARTDSQTRSGGQGSTSLLIHHHSAALPDSFAMMKQVVPVVGGSRYQVSIWAKSEQIAADGIRIVMNAQRDQPTIVLPGGSYQWQRFSGEFAMPGTADVIHPLSTSIEIVSAAPGESLAR